MLNIATCLYKQNEEKKAIEMCNNILSENDGKKFTKAYFKKASFLLCVSAFEEARYFFIDLGKQRRKELLLLRMDIQVTSRKMSLSKF